MELGKNEIRSKEIEIYRHSKTKIMIPTNEERTNQVYDLLIS
jgi:hypothetical protein